MPVYYELLNKYLNFYGKNVAAYSYGYLYLNVTILWRNNAKLIKFTQI